MCFDLCSLPPVLLVATSERLAPSSSLHPIRYSCTCIRVSQSLFLFRISLSLPPREICQSFNHFCGPVLHVLQLIPIFLVLGSLKLDTVLEVWSHQCQVTCSRNPRDVHSTSTAKGLSKVYKKRSLTMILSQLFFLHSEVSVLVERYNRLK